MQLELARFFLISLPQNFFALAAAIILFKISINKYLSNIFLASIVIALFTFTSFHLIKIAIVNLIINLVACTIVIRIILKPTWFHVVVMAILTHIFIFVSTILGFGIAINLLKVPPSQAVADPLVFVKAFLPSFICNIPAAYALRPVSNLVLKSFLKIRLFSNLFPSYQIILALVLQSFLFFSIFNPALIEEVGFSQPVYIMRIISLALFILTVYIVVKSVNITEKRILAQGQLAISDNVMELVNSVRSQRHDFTNSLQIIHSLVHSDNKESLIKYLSQLTGSVSFYNKLLTVNEPIISAFFNSKITQADVKETRVSIDITADLSKLSTKAFDITRILGNLVDNALDAVSTFDKGEREIKITIEEKGPFLLFSVTNPGVVAEEVASEMFSPGYTTKDNNHSGLGLYISKELAKKMHGSIQYSSSEESGTTFTLVMPKN